MLVDIYNVYGIYVKHQLFLIYSRFIPAGCVIALKVLSVALKIQE